MSFKKTLFMGLLASTMLAGCDSDDKSPPADTTSQGTFDQLKAEIGQLKDEIGRKDQENQQTYAELKAALAQLQALGLGDLKTEIAGLQSRVTAMETSLKELTVLSARLDKIDNALNGLAAKTLSDEDRANGEMSGWYVLGAMGFYPVSMGRPEYAIGAPYFEKMSIKLENGKKIIINAPGVSSANRYVQSVELNGKPYTRNYLLHSDIKDGATLDFVMGPNPSQWGTGENDVPTSITQGSAKPTPLVSLLPTAGYDVTASTATNVGRVFDRNSDTEWSSPAGTAPWIEADLKAGKTSGVVKLYTLTSGASAGQDPAGWTLKGSNDGTTWETLDERKDQAFTWRRQTRPFAIKDAKAYSRYRLEFTGTAAITVPEFELLAEPLAP